METTCEADISHIWFFFLTKIFYHPILFWIQLKYSKRQKTFTIQIKILVISTLVFFWTFGRFWYKQFWFQLCLHRQFKKNGGEFEKYLFACRKSSVWFFYYLHSLLKWICSPSSAWFFHLYGNVHFLGMRQRARRMQNQSIQLMNIIGEGKRRTKKERGFWGFYIVKLYQNVDLNFSDTITVE